MSSKWLYGNGGHAKVILDWWKPDYIIDDDPSKGKPWTSDIPLRYRYGLIAIGDNKARKAVADRIEVDEPMYGLADLANHDRAVCDVGTIIMKGAVVQPGAWLRMHCILNTCASVDHDCEIADFVHIGPGAHLCGNVRVGEGTLIGAGTIVTPGVKIGPWLVIPAGSVVTKDCTNEDDVASLRRR